jgi:hypothetical protein
MIKYLHKVLRLWCGICLLLLLRMKNLKIILTLTAFTLGIGGCVKSPSDKYVKESLELKFTPNSNGTHTLEWSLVNTTELLQYEIYHADNDTFGVHTSSRNIIGTVKDRNVTSFDLSNADIQADSMVCPKKHYYKVAAVFKDRKIVSKTMEGPPAYLAAMPFGNVVLSFNNHPNIYLRSGTNSSGTNFKTHRLNVESGAFNRNINWPFLRALTSSSMQSAFSLGASASGQLELAEQTINPVNFIRFYNPDNAQFIREIPLNDISSVNNLKLINGVIFAIANSSNSQLQLYAINSATGSTIGSIPITGTQYSPHITVSSDGKTIIIHHTQFNILTPQIYQYNNGIFTNIGILKSNTNSSFFEDISMSSDASIILRAPGRKIYNLDGTTKVDLDITTGGAPRGFVLSDNKRFIFFDGFTGFSLRNCGDGSLIKEIGVPFTQDNINALTPMVINDKLYVSASVQASPSLIRTVIKAVPY